MDMKDWSVADLRCELENAKIMLKMDLLRGLIPPVLIIFGSLITTYLITDVEPVWLLDAMKWTNVCASLFSVVFIVYFGGRAFDHYKQLQAVKQELDMRVIVK